MRDALRVAVVIPARNEAATVGAVVAAARAAGAVQEVIVVDDGSGDETGAVASAHGARVVQGGKRGKGQAMVTGARATDAEVLVVLDADLTGLRPDHVDRLADTVLRQQAAMAVGLFDRGRLLNPIFLHVLPRLAGERALRRQVVLSLDPAATRGYRIEAALNSHVAQQRGQVRAFVLDGVFHRTKEKKDSSAVRGFVRKSGMLSLALWEYVAYRLRGLRRPYWPVRRSVPPTARATTSADRAPGR